MPGRAQRRLAKAVVEALEAPRRGSVYLGDSEVPGFAVRVHRGPRGIRRTYVYRFSDRGSGRGAGRQQITIGLHGSPWTDPRTGQRGRLTCELARGEALRLRGLRNAGGDVKAAYRPALAPVVREGAQTLATFAATYLAKHSDVHKATTTALADRGRLEGHILPRQGGVALDTYGPAHVRDLQAALRRTPIAANRCVALLSHMFTMARRWGVLVPGHPNPCADVQRFPENKRERYLTPAELGRVGAALEVQANDHPYEVAAVRVLMFTGARPSEILTLRRDQVQLGAGVVVQASKTGPRPIALPPEAVRIIRDLPKLDGNPYVFPDVNRSAYPRPVTRWQLWAFWKRVREAAKCTDVHAYDVRHTFASVALAGGASLEFIGGLLGHTKPETTQRYAHLARAADPMRKVGEKAAREIARALGKR